MSSWFIRSSCIRLTERAAAAATTQISTILRSLDWSAVSCMRLLDSGGEPVAQTNQSASIALHVLECEPGQRCSRFQERDAAPEQHWHDQHLHEIDLLGLKQAPEQIPAAKQPDGSAARSAERSYACAGIGSYDRDAWLVLWRQGSREDIDLPALRPGRGARLAGEFIGTPPQQDCVHRLVDLREVHRGVMDNPIHLAMWPGDVPVNTRGNSVQDFAHLTPTPANSRCLT